MFHDPRLFAFTAELERQWLVIREEFERARPALVDWYERKLYGQGWKVFTVFGFPHGEEIAQGERLCPVTAGLVRQHIPRHGAAGFSLLEPGTRIRPHEGYAGDFLRCHLGLRIPPGDCGLRVGDTVRRWEEGQALVFDDRGVHEAWNLTAEDRVVLIVDFVPPE